MFKTLILRSLVASAALILTPATGSAAGVADVPKLTLPAGVFADGLAVAADDTVYISGVFGGVGVYRALPGETEMRRFISPPEGEQVQYNGIALDSSQTLLHVCVNRNVFTTAPHRISEVRVYERQTGALVKSYPFPDFGTCDDISFDRNGNLYITDSMGTNPAGVRLGTARVLVLRAGASSIQEWVRSPELYGEIALAFDNVQVNGIAIMDDQVFVNSTGTFKTHRIPIKADGSAGPLSLVQVTRPLDTPDGMCVAAGKLLITEVGIIFSARGRNGKIVEAALSGPPGFASNAWIKKPLAIGDSISTCTASSKYFYFLESQFGKAYFPDRMAEGLKPSVIHRRSLETLN